MGAFVPPPIHAGGLRHHGMASTVSRLVEEGLVTPKTVNQLSCHEAGALFAKTEGFIPAPEITHALAQTIAGLKDAIKGHPVPERLKSIRK